MKNISLAIIAIVAFASASAQLKNTRWNATLELNGSVNTMIDFGKDTALVYTVSDSTMIEKMTYTSNDTSFTLMKIEGQSQCDNIPGKYGFTIKENNLSVKVLKDECYDRSNVLENTTWTRWKEPSMK
jgi:hypothetical protein